MLLWGKSRLLLQAVFLYREFCVAMALEANKYSAITIHASTPCLSNEILSFIEVDLCKLTFCIHNLGRELLRS